MIFELEDLINILDGPEYTTDESTAQSDEPVATHLLFDWATTTQSMRAFNPRIKIAYKAKFWFACAISSFADEIMEYLLKEKTHITASDMADAFAHFNEPIGSFELILSKPLSLQRIMAKYRSVYKFTITSDAKRVFARLMTSFMMSIALNIHIHRNHARKTIQIDEVQSITDAIVYIRDYSKKYTASRSIHASRRVRKPNGRF